MGMRIVMGKSFGCAFAVIASLGAESKADTAVDVLREVNGRLEREFIGGDGLVLDYVGDIPDAKEIEEHKPNAMGWWTPIENGSMFTGEWLPALMAEGLAKKSLVERCVKGLIKMSEVSDVPGFIARGTGSDGKSHYPCGSNDQTDPWFLGLVEYCLWPHADPVVKSNALDRLVFVAKALEANAWGVPCDGAFKGENRGNLNARRMPFWGKSRLLYTLKALHLLTGDAHWGEQYRSIKSACIAEIEDGGEIDSRCFKPCFGGGVWIYVASAQMLARLIELEDNAPDGERMRKGLLHYAERVAPQMELCSKYDNEKVRPFKYANWREGYDWRPQKTQKEAEAVASSAKREVLGGRKWHEREFMSVPLAAAAICALADRDRYHDAILATLRHYDYGTPNISEFFHAAIAASAMALVAQATFGAETQAWRPSERWCGFNLLGMFCRTRLANGDKRVSGYFPEDHFLWMEEWGFNFVRLPLDYRFLVEEDDWMKPVESQLKKLDEAVRHGKRHGVHVQINFHRAPGYCCNPPKEPKSLFLDPAPLAAFTNLWSVLARRYRGIPNEELSFDLVNEPAPVAFYGATPSNYAVVARAAFAAIRAEDPNRFVMSDGWKWGQAPVMELHPFDCASGESIHCYEPHRVTHYRVFNPNDPRPCPPWPPEGCEDGVEWLERNFVKAWRPAIDDGTFLFVGECGCIQRTGVPHATYLVWLEDMLKMCNRHGWGWALWNLDGTFGILDTSRTDCEFEDFHGHKLDRKALDLLRKYARRR